MLYIQKTFFLVGDDSTLWCKLPNRTDGQTAAVLIRNLLHWGLMNGMCLLILENFNHSIASEKCTNKPTFVFPRSAPGRGSVSWSFRFHNHPWHLLGCLYRKAGLQSQPQTGNPPLLYHSWNSELQSTYKAFIHTSIMYCFPLCAGVPPSRAFCGV